MPINAINYNYLHTLANINLTFFYKTVDNFENI